MNTKQVGKLLFFVGLFALLFSLFAGYVRGDTRLGASQLLGMQLGVAVSLLGLFFWLLYPNSTIEFWKSVRSIIDFFLNQPVAFWIMVSFFLTFIFFFLIPVFFNSQHAFWYFSGYLPHKFPIGLDNKGLVLYIEKWLAQGQSPYLDNYISYPPFALVLLAPLVLFDYPIHYFLITTITLCFYLVATVSAYYLVLKKQAGFILFAVFTVGLFSYGFQSELERGQFNVIAYFLGLLGVFLFHKKDEYRFPSYLIFTIGVQMKIYPAILIVMFIKDWRDWKRNLKRIAGILLFNFGLLFVAGYQIFLDFLHSVGSRTYGGAWDGTLSIQAFVNQLFFDGYGLIETDSLAFLKGNTKLVELVLMGVLGMCLAYIILHAYRQKQQGFNAALLLVCTICGIAIPTTSFDYKLPILTIPMALFWSSLSLPEQRWKKITAILLIVISALAYWSVQYPFIVRPEYLNRSFPALFLIALVATALTAFVTLHQKLQVQEI